MPNISTEEGDFAPSPLDAVELTLDQLDITHDRSEDGDLHWGAKGAWCDVHGMFSTLETMPALVFTLTFDLRVPLARTGEFVQLISLINARLWLGHFALWSEDQAIVFRHTLPLVDRDEPTIGEIVAVLNAGRDAADNFYPAFNFLLWGGKTPAEALEATLFQTAGTA